MTYPYDNWKGGATCKIDGTIAQTAAASANFGFRLVCPEGTEYEVLSWRMSVGAVAAARTTTLLHVDSSNAAVMELVAVSMDDNQRYNGPVRKVILDDQTADTVNNIGWPIIPYPIAGGEKILFNVASAADGETWTMAIRVRIRGAIPTLEAVGTDVSVANLTVTVI